MMTTALLESLKDAIVKVGDGRGFLVDRSPWPHQVITAAHCLPRLPAAHPFSYTHERTYANLIGPVGEVPAAIWAECVFVDLIADLAVLREPDGQADLCDESEAYETFMEDRPGLQIGTVDHESQAYLLTLRGQWESCTVRPGTRGGRALTLVGAKEGNAAGTSGSPILTTHGRVVGVVSVGSLIAGTVQPEQSGQPALASCLPGWLLVELLAPKGDA